MRKTFKTEFIIALSAVGCIYLGWENMPFVFSLALLVVVVLMTTLANRKNKRQS